MFHMVKHTFINVPTRETVFGVWEVGDLGAGWTGVGRNEGGWDHMSERFLRRAGAEWNRLRCTSSHRTVELVTCVLAFQTE